MTSAGTVARGAGAVAPEDVAEVFAGVFDLGSVSIDDDFFALGGNSLLAKSLMIAIEKRFGVILALSSLLESSTPRQLCEVVNSALARTPGSCLMTVRAEGAGVPLFCLHGMDGHSTSSRQIASQPGWTRPVYALRLPGFLPGETVLTTVQDIAAHHLSEMRAVQPHGPYAIFGQCGAALIVLEMGQRLLKAGEPVAGLILADPLHFSEIDGRDVVPWIANEGMALALIQSRAAQGAVELAMAAEETPPETGEERRDLVSKIFRLALSAYVPKPLPGTALVISAGGRTDETFHPRRGMPRLLPNMERFVTGETHHDVFIPNAAMFEAVRAFLDKVAPA